MHVLIIEDSNTSRILLSKLLKSIIPNVETSLASNGKSALLLLASEIKFDLIILDLGLPDIGGLQVIELSKDLDLQCPVITISDESNQEALKKSIELGAVDYITKPLNRNQLIKVLKNHIAIKEDASDKKILIVEDDKCSRMILDKIAHKSAFKTELASNGFEAIRLVKKHYFSCILMDIRMPFMDGIEATQIIKRDFPDIPVIFITAEPVDQVYEQCIKVGGSLVLSKPINKKNLVSSIQNFVQKEQKEIQKRFQGSEVIKANSVDKSKFKIFEDFLKFVPKSFIEHTDLNQHMKRGLSRVEDCSVVFIDIRNFTEMSEKMQSDECFNFLNSYFEMIEPIINSFGGTVYQFLGDGIVCTFPLYKGKFSNNAVHATISIQDHITIYNKGRLRAGYEAISIGCGVSTGTVALGICGSNSRYEVGVFGTTMNIAARIQGACRDFGIGITTTSKVYERLENKEDFLMRPIGKHKLKGIEDKVEIYEVFSHNDPIIRKHKTDSLNDIRKFNLENESFPVETLAKKYPSDPLWKKLKSIDENTELH